MTATVIHDWPQFVQRVGRLFRDMKMDTLAIAVATYSDEPTVYRALHEFRERERQAA